MDAILGRGTRIRTKVQPWGFMAGLGVAFEVPLLEDRVLRIKPSVEYRRERIWAEIFLGEAQSLDGSAQCPCRSISLAAGEKQTLHAVGPGLELEVDSGRVGSVVITTYGAFRAYVAVDGRNVTIRGAGSFDDGTPANVRGRLSRDRWSYRYGVGVRFRWDPS